MTALHCAAAAGQLEAAKLLSKSGADPAIADLRGRYAYFQPHVCCAPIPCSQEVWGPSGLQKLLQEDAGCAWPF